MGADASSLIAGATGVGSCWSPLPLLPLLAAATAGVGGCSKGEEVLQLE